MSTLRAEPQRYPHTSLFGWVGNGLAAPICVGTVVISGSPGRCQQPVEAATCLESCHRGW